MSSSTDTCQSTHEDGIAVIFDVLSLIFQSLLYGVFAVLLPYSLYKIRHRKAKVNILMKSIIFMFTLSTICWIMTVIAVILRIHAYFVAPSSTNLRNSAILITITNAIILVNYIITDGVVVWRAWVLCKDDHPVLVKIPIALLIITAVSVAGTIVIRGILIVFQLNGEYTTEANAQLSIAIDVSQVAGFAMSLLTNVVATSVIAHKAWKHRQLLKNVLSDGGTSKVQKILELLLESGGLYILSGIVTLIAILTPLPNVGTVGDVYMPINGQIVGIYPTLVLVLVGMQRSMDNATFGDLAEGSISSIEFGPGFASSIAMSNQTANKPESNSKQLKRHLDLTTTSFGRSMGIISNFTKE